MNDKNKKGATMWLKPETIQRVDFWMPLNNCRSRSEFVEKALVFYIGYLETRDASTYLCEVLSTLIKGILENNNNRMRSLLLKWCVELNVACHTIAAHFGASEIERCELRAFAAREVKETNGQISFDHALNKQREV